MAKQIAPKLLDNGHAPLLLTGYSLSAKALKNPLPFWNSEFETPRLLANIVNHLYEWEGNTDESPIRVAELMRAGIMHFVDLYPATSILKKGFAPSVDLLRSYLQVVRPLVVSSMSHEVCQNIEPPSSHSLSISCLGI